jgi:hypothetical protein
MGRIEIRDAKRTVDGKKINAYRVKTIAENDETLQISEVLNSADAVMVHIKAMGHAWKSEGGCEVVDCTYRGRFHGKTIELILIDRIKFNVV